MNSINEEKSSRPRRTLASTQQNKNLTFGFIPSQTIGEFNEETMTRNSRINSTRLRTPLSFENFGVNINSINEEKINRSTRPTRPTRPARPVKSTK